MIDQYPTTEEVEKAGRYQVCVWWRYLCSPRNEEEIKIMNHISERFKEVGGFTPEISKSIGFTPTI